MVNAAAGLLSEAIRAEAKEVRGAALSLVRALVTQAGCQEAMITCREAAQAALADAAPQNRIRAIQLALGTGMNLLEHVVSLLRDGDPEVRRATVLAVGSAPEVVSTDELLPLLHDGDAKVRQLCEKALEGRGLSADHIRLGRLMTAADAKTRLQVLECLRRTRGIEPAIWVRRLSHDPSEAVRAAAVRAAGEFCVVHLNDRLEQIAQNDPSPTVRQLAQFYAVSARHEAP
jgi:HEAT repeat protein